MLTSNPLNLDYASKDSQGKASAIGIMGADIGVIVGNGVLLTALRRFDLNIFYTIIGATYLVFAFLTPFLIIEPPDL